MGNQEFSSDLSEQGLKDALISVFKTGPKDGGLDQYAEAMLAKSPYKKGEYEAVDWKLIVFPIVSLLAGFGFLGSDGNDVGLGLMVIVGGCLGLALVALFLWWVVSAFADAYREEEISRIEEGVRRAMRDKKKE